MRIPKEYYISNQQQISVVYDNDAAGGELVLDKIVDGTPYQHIKISQKQGRQKKVLVINNWRTSDLSTIHLRTYLEFILSHGFIVYQADGQNLHAIESIKDIRLKPKVICDKYQLSNLIFNKLQLASDQTFIIDAEHTNKIFMLMSSISLVQYKYLYRDPDQSINVYSLLSDLDSNNYHLVVRNKKLQLNITLLSTLNKINDPKINNLITIADNFDLIFTSKFTQVENFLNTYPDIQKKISSFNSNHLIGVNDNFLKYLSEFKQLTSLSLKNQKITRDTYETYLQQLSLKSLQLNMCNLETDFDPVWSGLEKITIIDTIIDDRLLKKHQSSLRNIELLCKDINIKTNLKLPQLTELYITLPLENENNEHVNYCSLNYLLNDTPQLNKLLLFNGILSDLELFSSRNKLTNLRVIRLGKITLNASQLKDILSLAPNLEVLILCNVNMIGEIQDALELPYLKTLVIDNTKLTSSSIAKILNSSNCLEYMLIPFFDDVYIPKMPATLTELVFKQVTHNTSTNIWSYYIALANIKIHPNLSITLDIEYLNFDQITYKDYATTPVFAINTVIFPKKMNDEDYLRLLMQTPNIMSSSNKLLAPIKETTISQTTPKVIVPLNLINITELNFEEMISESVLYSLITGCPNLKTLTFKSSKLLNLLPVIYFPKLQKIVLGKNTQISLDNLFKLTFHSPRLKLLEKFKDRFYEHFFGNYNLILNDNYDDSAKSVLSCFIPSRDIFLRKSLSNDILNCDTAYINNTSLLIGTKALGKIRYLYLGTNTKISLETLTQFYGWKYTNPDEVKIICDYITSTQLVLDASCFNTHNYLDFIKIINSRIYGIFSKYHAESIILEDAIISFETLKSLLENNISDHYEIHLTNKTTIISPNPAEVNKFINSHPNKFVQEYKDYVVKDAFPNYKDELYKWARSNGYDPITRYKELEKEYPMPEISNVEENIITEDILTEDVYTEKSFAPILPDFRPYRGQAAVQPSTNTWSQSLLIDRLNKYLRLIYSPCDEAICEQNNRGICIAVVEWYVKTLEPVTDINLGNDLWKKKLTTLSAWDGNYLPMPGSDTELFLTQLMFHTQYIYFAKQQTTPFQTIILPLTQIFDNPPTEVLYLENYCHRTCLIFRDNHWFFFDPNCQNGQAISFSIENKKNLEDTIHRVLGSAIVVCTKTMLNKSTYPETYPTDLNKFFDGGGFELICKKESALHIFQKFNVNERNTSELESIFYITTRNQPFWYIGLISEYGREFTIAWLERYKSLNAEEYTRKITQGLKLLTKEEQVNLRNILSDKKDLIIFPEGQTYIEKRRPNLQAPIITKPLNDDSIIESIKKKKTKPSVITFEEISQEKITDKMLDFHLALYEKQSLIPKSEPGNIFVDNANTQIPPETLTEFDYQSLSQKAQNILIEFSDDVMLQSYLMHVQQTTQALSRSMFVINSMKDLNCMSSHVYIEENNHATPKPAPSGPLFDFLEANHEKECIIVINWRMFTFAECIESNAILDGTAENIKLPKQALILSLQNINAPNAYRGDDFLSRHNQTINFPTNLALPALWEQQPQTLSGHSDPIVIEFYEEQHWQRHLYGHYEMKHNAMKFSPSLFLHTIQSAYTPGVSRRISTIDFIFKNAPMHIIEFRTAINSMLSTKILAYNNLRIQIPDINIITDNGYKFESHIPHEFFKEKYLADYEVALNPSSLSLFFVQYTYAEDSNGIGELSTTEGFIKQKENHELNIYLTRSIRTPDFAKLIEEANSYNCKLNITLAPNTNIPYELSHTLADNPSVVTSISPTELYVSNDLRMTEQELILENPDATIVDVSELNLSDVFFSMEAKTEGSKFIFKQKIKEIWERVCTGATVIFKGKISAELADVLTPLFTTNPHIYFNGSNQFIKGKVIVLTDNDELFNYVERKIIRNYTITDRIEKIEDREFKEYLTLHQATLSDFSYDKLIALSKHKPYPNSTQAWLKDIFTPPTYTYDNDYSLDEQSAINFLNERYNQIETGLERMPILLILGETGTGKSSFMHMLAADESKATDVFFDDVLAWASEPDPTNKRILFIDEANLNNSDFSIFETLFNRPLRKLAEASEIRHQAFAANLRVHVVHEDSSTALMPNFTASVEFPMRSNAEPYVVYKGNRYPLTNQHKIVLAGNPNIYGGMRKTPALLENHPNVVFFGEMNNAYLFHHVLKSFVQDNIVIGAIFLKVFRKIQAFDKSSISARELQMMGFLFNARDNIKDEMHAKQCAFDVAFPLVAAENVTEFKDWFLREFGELTEIPKHRPKELISSKDQTQPPFYLVPSHNFLYDKLDDLIKIRAFKQQTIVDSMKFGGISGIFVEGNPGVGKSHFIKQFLLANNFEEKKIEGKLTKLEISSLPKTKSNHFYCMPASMNYLLKLEVLYRAFHEGAVVIVDEINVSGTMQILERSINAFLMGEDLDGNRAINPGFTICSTGNPSSMEAREEAGLALKRRFIHCNCPDYTIREMHTILTHLGLSRINASIFLAQFLEAAKDTNNQVVKSFRTLYRKVIGICRQGSELPNYPFRLPTIGYQLITAMGEINDHENKWIEDILKIISMIKAPALTKTKLEDTNKAICHLIQVSRNRKTIEKTLKSLPHLNIIFNEADKIKEESSQATIVPKPATVPDEPIKLSITLKNHALFKKTSEKPQSCYSFILNTVCTLISIAIISIAIYSAMTGDIYFAKHMNWGKLAAAILAPTLGVTAFQDISSNKSPKQGKSF